MDTLLNASSPISLSIQEAFSRTTSNLSLIDHIELVRSADSCREESPCEIQPKIVVYDSNGKIIDKLGSSERPWQIRATIVNQTNGFVIGDVANYSDGQTQFHLFGFSSIGVYRVQFELVLPDNGNRFDNHQIR